MGERERNRLINAHLAYRVQAVKDLYTTRKFLRVNERASLFKHVQILPKFKNPTLLYLILALSIFTLSIFTLSISAILIFALSIFALDFALLIPHYLHQLIDYIFLGCSAQESQQTIATAEALQPRANSLCSPLHSHYEQKTRGVNV
jgi:hypothetical protein